MRRVDRSDWVRGLIGAIFGVSLGAGMAALGDLPLYGPVTHLFAGLIGTGILPGLPTLVVHPIGTLFGAGLGLLVLTIFFYAGAALALVGGAALTEVMFRGGLVGLSAAANLIIMAAIPWLPNVVGPLAFLVLMLACVPAISANRIHQRVIGRWVGCSR